MREHGPVVSVEAMRKAFAETFVKDWPIFEVVCMADDRPHLLRLLDHLAKIRPDLKERIEEFKTQL